jgi:anti-anti-sigma factor
MAQVSISDKDGRTTIRIHGDFVFALNREFRDVYQALPPDRPVTVDLSGAAYIDSAGLGMLVRLREHQGGEKRSVTLRGANPTIRNILDVANFGQLFVIE